MTDQEMDAAAIAFDKLFDYLKSVYSGLVYGLRSKEGEKIDDTFYSMMDEIANLVETTLEYEGAWECDWLSSCEKERYQKEVREELLRKIWRVLSYLPDWKLSAYNRNTIEKKLKEV